MLVDARQLAPATTIAADLCIVGAGPAGITIARALRDLPRRICLVESGGLDADETARALGRLGTVESDLRPPATAFHHQLGGTANLWNVLATSAGGGVRYMALDALDFEERAWLPHSGWPFGRTTLDPYYARAHALCGLPPYGGTLAAWETPAGRALPLDPASAVTVLEHFGTAAPFTTEAREMLAGAPNVTVLLHTTAVALEEDEAGEAVAALRVAAPGGARHRVTARHFVLAAGGIENPRLLLLARARRPAGLGNAHDLVGRFFMDHHNIRAGRLVPADPRLFSAAALYDLRQQPAGAVMGKLVVTESRRRHDQLLAAAARLEPTRAPDRLPAVQAARRLTGRLGMRGAPAVRANVARDVRTIIGGLPSLARASLQRLLPPSPRGYYGWSELPRLASRFDVFAVELQIELPPRPENRVVLVPERDPLDRPRAAVAWHWSALELRSLRRTQEILRDAFAAAGVGTLELPPRDAQPEVTMPGGIHHHIGTTRMHVDPRAGVVDADCKVHDVRNLFVAGSSVFPTGGYANSTLTIVALALRLAEHLRRRL